MLFSCTSSILLYHDCTLTKGTDGIRKKFQRHSQHLHQLECQLEASRQELLETGSKLQREERDAHIPLRRAKEVSGTYTQDSALNLPSIAVNRRPQARFVQSNRCFMSHS